MGRKRRPQEPRQNRQRVGCPQGIRNRAQAEIEIRYSCFRITSPLTVLITTWFCPLPTRPLARMYFRGEPAEVSQSGLSCCCKPTWSIISYSRGAFFVCAKVI